MRFLAGSSARKHLAARLLLAAYYAFLLPFICWGAVATPGHDHARAHFVFADPVLSADATSPLPHLTAAEVLKMPSLGSWCGAPLVSIGTHANLNGEPTGQSVPVMLGITLLAPLLLLAAGLANPNARSGFAFALPSVLDEMPLLRVSVPPPRA